MAGLSGLNGLGGFPAGGLSHAGKTTTIESLVSFLHNNKNHSSKANKEKEEEALRLPNFLLSFFLLIELPEVIFNREMERA